MLHIPIVDLGIYLEMTFLSCSPDFSQLGSPKLLITKSAVAASYTARLMRESVVLILLLAANIRSTNIFAIYLV